MAHAILLIFAKVVVPLFFFGMAGSALVVIATVVRDLGEATSGDHEKVTDL